MGGTRSPFDTPLAATRSREWVEELEPGALLVPSIERRVHRLALPAGGVRNDRLRFLSVAAHGARAARHGPRARRADRRSATSNWRARSRALHRTDRIGDYVSDEKLRLGGMALRNGLALLRPDLVGRCRAHPRRRPSRSPAARSPRLHAADRRAVRARRRAHGGDARALPMIRRGLPEARLLVRGRQRRRSGRRLRRRSRPSCAGAAALRRRARLDADRRRAVARRRCAAASSCATTAPSTRRSPATSRASTAVDDGQGARALRHAPGGAARCSAPSSPQPLAARAPALAAPAGAPRSDRWRRWASRSSCSPGRERHPRLARRPRASPVPAPPCSARVATAEPGEAELEVAERALAALLAAEDSAARPHEHRAARTRRRLPSEVFDLPVEKMRDGYYSDAYFVFTKQVLERDGAPPARAHAGLPAAPVGARRHGRGDRGAARVQRAADARTARWQPGWDELVVHALHDGDEIEPWETVMTIEGDYSLFCHLETVYLGTLSRRTLIARNVREVVRAAARQADPLLPGPPRPPPRADRRRLRRAHRGRDRRLDRRAGLVVGRPRHRHGAARADRGLRRRHRAAPRGASSRRSAPRWT